MVVLDKFHICKLLIIFGKELLEDGVKLHLVCLVLVLYEKLTILRNDSEENFNLVASEIIIILF